MADIPGVFISSTFYDLSQVRADLVDFVQDELGYRALASELPSFPVDPTDDTIENCRHRVEEQADIFVLIIGARYGYISVAHGKSITNLEYLAARAKGIPIYVFVERDVLTVLPTWKANPDADFSATVDDSELFAFLERVMSGDRVWVIPFGTAQEITHALRIQLGYLMSRGLTALGQMRGHERELRDLTGKALELAIERPIGWQGKLFAQILMDEIDGMRDLKRADEHRIAFGPSEQIPEEDRFDWVSMLLHRGRRLSEGLTRLVNDVLGQVINTDDVSLICYSSRQAAAGYREGLEWASEVRRASLPEEWEQLIQEMALILGNITVTLEDLGPRIIQQLDEMISRPLEDREPINIEIVFELANWDQFNEELEKIKDLYGL